MKPRTVTVLVTIEKCTVPVSRFRKTKAIILGDDLGTQIYAGTLRERPLVNVVQKEK